VGHIENGRLFFGEGEIHGTLLLVAVLSLQGLGREIARPIYAAPQQVMAGQSLAP
jgi:hypothetical protein